MANTDYSKNGNGSFASVIALDTALSHFDTTISFTRARVARPDAIQPGMAAMVGHEILRIETVTEGQITVKRGCADTVPATHPVDMALWIFNAAMVGADRKERSAGEIASVKVSPYTVGGGGVPVGAIPPQEVEFNWRVFRPYPPGRMRANGERWTVAPTLDDTTPDLHLTWAHRDRVLQADQLIGHDDDPIGPETGVTYTLRIYNPATDEVVRTESGIQGGEFLYRRAQALHDQGNPNTVRSPEYALTATRDGFDAWQSYMGSFSLQPTNELLDVQIMAFAQRVIESPYIINVKRGVAAFDGNHVLAVAARPSDRMADEYRLLVDSMTVDAARRFCPWVVSDFRLPELETIINVRTASLYDGVTLDAVQVGHMAMIDDEIVQVVRVGRGVVEVRRGCADTIPAVHLAGSRVWFFEVAASFAIMSYSDVVTLACQLHPVSYGEAVDPATLPVTNLTMNRRAELPYAPGRMVVNGRPWFEEAQALAGSGVSFSWARRNRVAQGAGVVAHADADQLPETEQTTRLRFYYETPAVAQGDPAVVNVLREVDVNGTTFVYAYAQAQADGNAAGQALGICGTVVIYCRIFALRAGFSSLQSYVAPIRVPSFPC